MMAVFSVAQKCKALGVAFLCSCTFGLASQSQAESALTAMPVAFTSTLDSAHAHVGDKIYARTMQDVVLPDGTVVKKGSRVEGRVVAASGFALDSARWAKQKPASLSIRFDQIEAGKLLRPIVSRVRAVAAAADVKEAESVNYSNEMDTEGHLTLIGGPSYSPWQKRIATEDGRTVGYQDARGVVAHLESVDTTIHGLAMHCSASSQENATAVFSGHACGLYGFGENYLAEDGSHGLIALRSQVGDIRLYRGSAALLEVLAE